MERRWKQLGTAIAVILGILACKAAYIQIIGHEDLSAAAQMQQQITLEGADTRGVIYDRNGTPVAGEQEEYIFIIQEDRCDGETLNALKRLNAEEVMNQDNSYRVFTSRIYSKQTGERLIENSGAYIIEADRRYSSRQPAVHMIGYVNSKDNSGASGLELMYDEQLAQVSRKVSATADVQGNLLQGYGLKVTSAEESDASVTSGITTTLELGLQLEVERILNECENDGAAVVTDCRTGEILAAASTPVFDPASIEEYMESDGGELINKVTQGEYPPGSVFKIVVAAAALEAGIGADKTFTCSGSETVNGHVVKCSTGGDSGHGRLTLEQAFADSCNCAFIQLGKMTGADNIIETAEKMGLGSVVLDSFPGENVGNLMTTQESQGAAIANLSIGQGETLVTPLQVAHMTAIIASGGVDTGADIILKNTGETDEVRVISEETAEKIKSMMKQAAEEGTGKDMELAVSAGVKTGSAQSTQGGAEVVHGWITGYVPADEPEYVISVFIEDGKSGRMSAAPVFEQIVEYLDDNEMLENKVGI